MSRRPKQTFLQRRHTEGQEAHEKMLKITNQWNANQTTMRYHLALVRIAIIKISTNNKCWRGYGEEETLLHCWWEYKLVQLLWRTVWRIFKKTVHYKGNQSWIFIGRTDVEAETPILWTPDAKSWFIRKDPDAGKDWRQGEKGTTNDDMVGWHHWLNGHEFE